MPQIKTIPRSTAWATNTRFFPSDRSTRHRLSCVAIQTWAPIQHGAAVWCMCAGMGAHSAGFQLEPFT